MDPLFITLADTGLVDQLANTAETLGKQFGFDIQFFIAQVVNFVFVAAILYFFAFRPVLRTVDQRQKEIDDGLQYAEEMKNKLAETEKKYAETMKKGTQEAQRTIEEAREQAKRISEKQTQESIAKSEDILKNARVAANQEREKMLEEAHKEIVSLVVETTHKVLRKELSEDERARYSEAAAREIAANN